MIGITADVNNIAVLRNLKYKPTKLQKEDHPIIFDIDYSKDLLMAQRMRAVISGSIRLAHRLWKA